MSESCLSLLSLSSPVIDQGKRADDGSIGRRKKWGYPISTVTDCEQGAPSELKHGETDKRREKTSKKSGRVCGSLK